MKRTESQTDIEARLRSELPSGAEAPAWVRTRVLAAMDEAQDGGAVRTPVRGRLALGLGGLALAAVAVGAVLWVTPAAQPALQDDWRSEGPVRIALPASMRLPGPAALEAEARHIRADFVDLLGVVRVPMEKLTEASRQFAGAV